MSLVVEKFLISSKGFDDYIDITSKIQDIAVGNDSKNALINLYVSSPCAGLKIIENEPGLEIDIKKIMNVFAPVNKIYEHDNVWHDGNAFSHLKTFLVGNSLSIPVVEYRLALGQNQRIIMFDFDNKVSQKEIIVSIIK